MPTLEWSILCLILFLWAEGAVFIAAGCLNKMRYTWIGIGMMLLAKILSKIL